MYEVWLEQGHGVWDRLTQEGLTHAYMAMRYAQSAVRQRTSPVVVGVWKKEDDGVYSLVVTYTRGPK